MENLTWNQRQDIKNHIPRTQPGDVVLYETFMQGDFRISLVMENFRDERGKGPGFSGICIGTSGIVPVEENVSVWGLDRQIRQHIVQPHIERENGEVKINLER